MAPFKYTEVQIQFIMDKKVEGYTYSEIAEQFGVRFRLSKSNKQISDTFQKYKHKYELPEFEKHPEKVRRETRVKIIDAYTTFIRANGYLPTYSDLESVAPSRTIFNYFNGLDDLDHEARLAYPSAFKRVIDEFSFGPEEFAALKKDVTRYQRFVITTAVTGCDVNQKALESLKNYCKRNKAKLLILPCQDPAASRGRSKWQLDPKLDKKAIVFKDLNLNSKFFISTIKLSAKHINPLTGLSRIGQRNGSFCYASPKQSLEYVATSAVKKIPRALMTTGAITKPQYGTKRYMSERTAYIAEHDHVMGAIIVELKNNKEFFFRQIQIKPTTGTFYDIDTQYFPDGKIRKYNGKDHTADLVQFGDYHMGDTDPMAKAVGRDICDVVTPKCITVEDFLNGHSINHHEEGRPLTLARKVEKAYHILDTELQANAVEFKEIMSWGNHSQLIVKYGNHEDFLFRYLDNLNFVKDKVNYKRAIDLSNAILNYGWKNPFEYAMREVCELGDTDRIRFLQDADESFMVNGIENGVHGHLGPNGTRAPGMAGIEKCYGRANVGHTHSAAILRGIFRVGTTSFLKVSYNKGPGSWTQTHLIQHPDGSRQLINCIKGKWRLV